MFRRGGGPSFSPQGTGITSGLDTPRRGLVQYPGGYAGERTKEDIQLDIEQVVAPKPYENINDIIASFGQYANAYKDDGTAKTTGEMGWEQAQMIDKIRKDREALRDAAKISGYEREISDIDKREERAHEFKKLGKQHGYDLARDEAKYGFDLKVLAKSFGYDLDKLDIQKKNELENIIEKYGYDLKILKTGSKYELEALKEKHKYNKEIEKMRGENLEFERMIKTEKDRMTAAINALDKTDPEYNNTVAALQNEFDNITKQIIRGTPGMTELLQNSKDSLMKLHTTLLSSTGSSYLQDELEQWNAKNPDKPKTITEWIQEQAVADVAGTTTAAGLLIQQKATGGRVGYQMGTPQTGAMPIQQASLTETIDTPTQDITATETITEGQQGSVQMPYQEFRASIPAEVSDEIVQLIYYNQDAFADFAQITTQSDVYAFNNKYGVSLVLPMDTETT